MKLSILGARVIDPASGLDHVTDLHVEAGKIIAIGAGEISSQDLLASADKAMYAAKHGGGRRYAGTGSASVEVSPASLSPV